MNDLMTLDDITEMLRLSRYHVRDVVVKTPGTIVFLLWFL